MWGGVEKIFKAIYAFYIQALYVSHAYVCLQETLWLWYMKELCMCYLIAPVLLRMKN